MSLLLLVSRRQLFRELLAASLESHGYNVVCVDSGTEALGLLRQRPSAIVVHMAHADGVQGKDLPILARSGSAQELPIVVVADESSRDCVLAAARSGARAFLLCHQVSLEELLERIEHAIVVAEFENLSNTEVTKAPVNAACSAEHAGSADPGGHHSRADTPLSRRPSPEPEPPSFDAEVEPVDSKRVIRRVLRDVCLQAMPTVLQKVLSLSSGLRGSIDEVAHALREDAALAMRVLKVANSSYYATERRAHTVSEAVQRIGLRGIRNTVTAIMVADRIQEASEGGIVPQRFWEHSLATGVLAQAVGSSLDAVDGEELFMAGMLHDIGQLCLAQHYPAHYLHALTIAREQSKPLIDEETALFGLTHADMSARILAEWKLPESLRQAASFHELEASDIQHAAKEPLLAVGVALADRLAQATLLGANGCPVLASVDQHIQAMGLDEETLEAIVSEGLLQTNDAILAYASDGDEPLLPPLSSELKRSVLRSCRPIVYGSKTHSIRLFLKQLCRLDSPSPTVSVLCLDHLGQVEVQLASIEKQERATNERLPILAVIHQGQEDDVRAALRGRQHEVLGLPCSYEQVLDAIVALCE
jgi:HD-like signal output (HDOD) protein/DNA-binding NarL/FixJ family response regulator